MEHSRAGPPVTPEFTLNVPAKDTAAPGLAWSQDEESGPVGRVSPQRFDGAAIRLLWVNVFSSKEVGIVIFPSC